MAVYSNINGVYRESDSSTVVIDNTRRNCGMRYTNINGIWRAVPALPEPVTQNNGTNTSIIVENRKTHLYTYVKNNVSIAGTGNSYAGWRVLVIPGSRISVRWNGTISDGTNFQFITTNSNNEINTVGVHPIQNFDFTIPIGDTVLWIYCVTLLSVTNPIELVIYSISVDGSMVYQGQ